MMYCPTCRRLGKTICPKCKKAKKMRPVQDNDAVLLACLGYIDAMMLEDVLKETEVPFERRDSQGWALTLGIGLNLDTISYYVPYCAYEICINHLKEVFESEGSILQSVDSIQQSIID